jgi:hypothetical protein
MFAPSMIGVALPAHASQFGCKVMLCLANPAWNGGPKSLSDCVEPINQLYHDLSRGRPYPRCDLADGNDGLSYACQVFYAYDPRLAPVRPAASGSYGARERKAGGNDSGNERRTRRNEQRFEGREQCCVNFAVAFQGSFIFIGLRYKHARSASRRIIGPQQRMVLGRITSLTSEYLLSARESPRINETA